MYVTLVSPMRILSIRSFTLFLSKKYIYYKDRDNIIIAFKLSFDLYIIIHYRLSA